jgi:hypothetical protein
VVGNELLGGVVTLVEVDGADERLGGVGRNERVRAGVALGLAAAELEILGNAKLLGDGGQRFGFDVGSYCLWLL